MARPCLSRETFRRLIVLASLLSASSGAALAAQVEPEVSQAEKDTAAAIARRVLATRDSLQKVNRTLQFGLSIGIRMITDLDDVNIRNVVISPIDTTLRVDKRDPTDVVLSGVISVYPWKKREATRISVNTSDTTKRDTTVTYKCGACGLGFVANINLASFNADNIATFNRSIEGGIGLAWRLTDDFALAATYERVFSRRIRDFVLPGQRIIVDGKALTAITEDDNRFFVDDNLNAVSVKFVYII
jgi:hypothetical protein